MRWVFLLCGGLAFAQDTLPLSLKRAVEIALAPEGSPRVALAEESIRQSQTGIAQARAAFLPDIEASVTDQNETVSLKSYGFAFKLPPGLDFAIPGFVGPFSVFDARATANQTVFDFSSIRKYQSSKATVEATQADAGPTKNQGTGVVARGCLEG